MNSNERNFIMNLTKMSFFCKFQGLGVTAEAQQELCLIIASAVTNSITISEFKTEMTAWGEKYGVQDKIAAFNKRGDDQVSAVIQDAIRYIIVG